jgi:hypothetical protein
MEIEFFAVSGSAVDDNKVESLSVKKMEQNLDIEGIASGYSLVVSLMGTNEQVYQSDNAALTQFMVSDTTLSKETLLASDGKATLTGTTLLNIADSSLQLKKIRGITVSIKLTDDK